MDLDLTDFITLFWTLFQMYERFLKAKPTKKKRKSKSKGKRRK